MVEVSLCMLLMLNFTQICVEQMSHSCTLFYETSFYLTWNILQPLQTNEAKHKVPNRIVISTSVLNDFVHLNKRAFFDVHAKRLMQTIRLFGVLKVTLQKPENEINLYENRKKKYSYITRFVFNIIIVVVRIKGLFGIEIMSYHC